MNELLSIFQELSFDEVQGIADEYNFRPLKVTSKLEFDKTFSQYLLDTQQYHQVIARYGEKAEIPDAMKDRAVKLFAFQVKHKELNAEGLYKHTTFINASETGVGKTYMTLSLAETERRPLFVICPKSMVLDWYLLALKHNVEILAICNYETIIKGKMYVLKGDANMDKLPRIENPYLKRNEEQVGTKKKKTVTFEWQNLPEGTLMVFDEAHYCKNITAQRTQLLITGYDYARHPENLWRRIGILLLSATIIEKKENLAPFMYVLGYTDDPRNQSFIDDQGFSVRDFGRKLIAERRMTRITMKEAKEALNDNHISDIRTKVFQVNDDDREKIEKACQEIRAILLDTGKKKSQNHLAVRMQKRREIEAIKISILMNECKRLRGEGYVVIIFVNFKESLHGLESMLKEQMPNEKHSVIIGGQEASTRLKEIQKFQEGDTDIMLSMVTAGGTGISLHDTKGGRRRYVLISPPESATQTIQCLGRAARIGGKSDSTQRIIFIAGTIEEKIAENLAEKIQTISDLNNDDERADNLFLYDQVHRVQHEDEDEEPAATPAKAATIQVGIDRVNNRFFVVVPDYMVDAFEVSIPVEALVSMKSIGDKYYFDMKFLPVMKEYLQKLNV